MGIRGKVTNPLETVGNILAISVPPSHVSTHGKAAAILKLSSDQQIYCGPIMLLADLDNTVKVGYITRPRVANFLCQKV